MEIVAKICDPFRIQRLLSISSCVDINDTDEEGLAAIYRLTGSQIDRTLLGNAYRGRVFRGSRTEQRALMKQVV